MRTRGINESALVFKGEGVAYGMLYNSQTSAAPHVYKTISTRVHTEKPTDSVAARVSHRN